MSVVPLKLNHMSATTSPSSAPATPAPTGYLSPSRAGDFMQCPQLYKYRAVDKLPEPPSTAMTKGTLVHAVLEELFTHPPLDRTPATAKQLVHRAWSDLVEKDGSLPELLAAENLTEEDFFTQAGYLLDSYYTLEDPARLEPAATEMRLEHRLPNGLSLLGYVDRLDVAKTGQVRVVDYKTGKAPAERFQDKALFQMKFYALMWWREKGTLPTRLQLLYLGSSTTLTYDPTQSDILETERQVLAIWEAIQEAKTTGHWQTKTSKLCDWCYHKKYCPAWSD